MQRYDGSDSIQWVVYDLSSRMKFSADGGTISLNKIQSTSLGLSSSHIDPYINGELVTGAGSGGGALGDAANYPSSLIFDRIYIGDNPQQTGQNLNGQLFCLRAYDCVLPQSVVAENFALDQMRFLSPPQVWLITAGSGGIFAGTAPDFGLSSAVLNTSKFKVSDTVISTEQIYFTLPTISTVPAGTYEVIENYTDNSGATTYKDCGTLVVLTP
jgi:hypothetical protein